MTYHKLLKYREVKDPEMTSPILDCLSPHLTRFVDTQAPLGYSCCVEDLPSSQMCDQQPLQEKAKRACPHKSHPPRLLFHSTLDGPGEDWKERFSALAFRFGKFVSQPTWPHTSQPKLGWQLGSTSPRRGEFHTSSWSPRVALGAVIIFTFV